MLKKSVVKRVILSLVVLVVLGIVAFIYFAFSGNPLHKMSLKRETNRYLAENYPNFHFRVKNVDYNPLFDQGYTINITDEGVLESYNCSFSRYPDMLTDPIRQSLENKIRKEFEPVINKLKTEDIIVPNCMISILDTKNLTPQLNLKDIPINVEVSIFFKEEKMKNISENKIKNFLETLNTEFNHCGYNIEKYTLLSNLVDGREDITITPQDIKNKNFKSINILFTYIGTIDSRADLEKNIINILNQKN